MPNVADEEDNDETDDGEESDDAPVRERAAIATRPENQ
jgi:hypothetical protein